MQRHDESGLLLQVVSDLKGLAASLLETINDKNLALNHQRKSNKSVPFAVVCTAVINVLTVHISKCLHYSVTENSSQNAAEAVN